LVENEERREKRMKEKIIFLMMVSEGVMKVPSEKNKRSERNKNKKEKKRNPILLSRIIKKHDT
jgi:hypothetical protein